MFTGIITDVGEIVSVEERAGDLRRIRIACRLDTADADLGASIACAGVCLTVVDCGREHGRGWFAVDLGAETLAVTNAGRWRLGTPVNLERALKLGDELGGHLVAGHVDGIARVEVREDGAEMAGFTFALPRELSRLVAAKGSVAVDGVSLTVNAVEGGNFTVWLIPHTLGATTLGALQPNDAVHVEVDLLARYVARLLQPGH